MKKIILSILVALPICAFAQGTWTQRLDFPDTRYSGAGFTIGTKAYFGTGGNSNITGTKDFWEYDAINNVWTQLADFPGGLLTGAVGFSIGGKGYVGTGCCSQGAGNNFWEYDPINNSWTQVASCPGADRSYAVAFVINNKAYVGTGDGGMPLNDFWEYDPIVNTWTQIASIGTIGIGLASAFTINQKGYVVFGVKQFMGDTNEFWEYDPITNTWTQLANAVTARSSAVSFALGGKGYVGGGRNYNTGQFFNDFWEYDPVGNTWTQMANLPFNPYLELSFGFTIGQFGYICGGIYTTVSNDLWEFSPLTSVAGSDKSEIEIKVNNFLSETLYISINDGTSNQAYCFELIGIDGRVLKTALINNGKNEIALNNMPNGIYTYRIRSEAKIFTGKIIIVH